MGMWYAFLKTSGASAEIYALETAAHNHSSGVPNNKEIMP